MFKSKDEFDAHAGLTMSYPRVKEVVDGNPGALNVVIRLQHRTHWLDMVRWLHDNGYCGESLWILYKDVFRESLFALGDFIEFMRNSKHYQESLSHAPSVEGEFRGVLFRELGSLTF